MSDFPDNFATAEVGVFWDIDQCEISDDLNAGVALQNMRKYISERGHRGPVSIRAYGDMKDHVFPTDEIKLNHFPAGEKHARHTKILEDIVSWAAEHPEPSTLMLIMGDASDDFVQVVELLTSKKDYRFIHVSPPPRPTLLILVARPAGN